VVPITGLDAVEKRKIYYLSPSQYRLSHPGFLCESNIFKLWNSAQICIGVKVIFVIAIVNNKFSEFLRIVNQPVPLLLITRHFLSPCK
jgi:hypothetical protein